MATWTSDQLPSRVTADEPLRCRLRRPARAAGPVRAGAARPPDLGHRPLQLPLPVLHARGGVRPRLRLPPARRGAVVRGDRAPRVDLRRPRRPQAADHRRRAARPPRPAVARRPPRAAADDGRRSGRPHADHQRLRAPGARRAAGRRRPAAHHRQPRLPRRRRVRPDERRRLPGVQGARGDRRGARGRARADQDQHRRAARHERGVDPAAGALGARRGPGPAVHRVHGRRPLERLAARRRRARPRRSWRRSTPSCRSSR